MTRTIIIIVIYIVIHIVIVLVIVLVLVDIISSSSISISIISIIIIMNRCLNDRNSACISMYTCSVEDPEGENPVMAPTTLSIDFGPPSTKN